MSEHMILNRIMHYHTSYIWQTFILISARMTSHKLKSPKATMIKRMAATIGEKSKKNLRISVEKNGGNVFFKSIIDQPLLHLKRKEEKKISRPSFSFRPLLP